MCRCITIQCRVCGALLRVPYRNGVEHVKCPCCGTQASLVNHEPVVSRRAAGTYGSAVGTPVLIGADCS
jgi:phage FluMu protein Com